MPRILTALILSAAMAGPVAAGEARLSGTVIESFGRQAVVATPEGRLLATLPDGASVPAPGTRVEMTGTRTDDTFAAGTVAVAAAADPAEAALPQALRGLGLASIRIRAERDDDDDETYVHARLPGGGWLRAEAEDGRLVEVQTDAAGLPQALIEAVLPPAVRNHPLLAEFVRITGIDLDDDDEIEVEGLDGDGMRIKLEIEASGEVEEFERERDDRRSLSESAARERLAAAGYAEVGFVRRGGRHVDAVALNPHGDWVEVRLDERGRVERERLWDR